MQYNVIFSIRILENGYFITSIQRMLLTWNVFRTMIKNQISQNIELIYYISGWVGPSLTIAEQSIISHFGLISPILISHGKIEDEIKRSKKRISLREIKGLIFLVLFPNETGISDDFHSLIIIYDGKLKIISKAFSCLFILILGF